MTDHPDHADELHPPPSPGLTCAMTGRRSASGYDLAIVVPFVPLVPLVGSQVVCGGVRMATAVEVCFRKYTMMVYIVKPV